MYFFGILLIFYYFVVTYLLFIAMRFLNKNSNKKKTECVVKTHDRSEIFVLQGNIVIIHQSLLNSIFTTKLYILMKKINYKQR
jgi:heme/copper-type cytochrome/quinol oxidase subunit 2